jgi:hypothetical protein
VETALAKLLQEITLYGRVGTSHTMRKETVDRGTSGPCVLTTLHLKRADKINQWL